MGRSCQILLVQWLDGLPQQMLRAAERLVSLMFLASFQVSEYDWTEDHSLTSRPSGR
jgi:hypothetical protein